MQVIVEYFSANEWRCLLVRWLREVGFTVVYGSLVLRIYRSVQSCPWVGLPHGLGWVGSGWVEIFQFLVGWVHYSKSTKNSKGLR